MSEFTIEVARPVIQQKAKQFEAALQGDPAAGRIRPVGYEPWMAAVFADFQRQPELCKAAVQAPETVWECLSVAAGCGLVPGSAGGRFYLIPRWSGKRQRVECTFIVGYKGFCELAYRHPRVAKVEAAVVYDGEPFEYEPGRGFLMHKSRGDIDRSDDKIVAAYARAVLTVSEGTHVALDEPVLDVMYRSELEATMEKSDSYKAWKSGKVRSTTYEDYKPRMFRKAPLRRLANGGSLPQSADLIVAVSAENAQDDRLRGEMLPENNPVRQVGNTLREAVGLAPKPQTVEEADAQFEEHLKHMPPVEEGP